MYKRYGYGEYSLEEVLTDTFFSVDYYSGGELEHLRTQVGNLQKVAMLLLMDKFKTEKEVNQYLGFDMWSK